MRVALHTTFAASRKEPLAVMLNRVHQGFLDSGLGEPAVRFTFSDAPLAGFVSSVDRVLKRLPDMQRFLATNSPMMGLPDVRRLSNAGSGEAAAFSSIQTIATGIPGRSRSTMSRSTSTLRRSGNWCWEPRRSETRYQE